MLDGIAKNWSWGLAIILLTITVRIVIWPLHAKSTHTMKRMAKLQPEMAKLKEKYADDPNKLNTETMGLYRKYRHQPARRLSADVHPDPDLLRFLSHAAIRRRAARPGVPVGGRPVAAGHPDATSAGVPINLLPVVMAISSFLQIR